MAAYSSEAGVRGLIAEVSDLIDRAGLGLSSWDEVSRQIVEFLPDSFCWINSQNVKTGMLNFAAIAGLSKESIAAYEDHFCTINPFNGVWDRFKAGEIITSEATIPLSIFQRTEFYNEFLEKAGDFRMGVGVKIDATDMDRFVMPIHFPLAMTDTYEPVVRQLFQSIEGNLKRASEFNRRYSDLLLHSISAAALTGRNEEIAFVVDVNLRIIETNNRTIELLAAGDILSDRSGYVVARSAETQAWLRSAAYSLVHGLPLPNNRHICKTPNHLWLFSVFRVPEHDPRGPSKFFGVRQLALVTVTNLRQANNRDASKILAGFFKLTPAERQLCDLLMSGQTLRGCADSLLLSVETIRTQIKSIFSKTGTSRQSELIALLNKI